MSTDGGSKITWFVTVVEMTVQVALLARIVSAALCK